MKLTYLRALYMSFFSYLICLTLTQCAPSFEAEYRDPHKVELIDDKWSQSDIDQIGKLIQDLNMKVARSPKKFGSNPSIIFKEIENRTDEHIDTVPIKNKIMDELLNADAFTFIDAAARKEILEEAAYQNKSGQVEQSTQVKEGKQIGAGFFLRGTISSTVNVQAGRKIVTYQLSLKVTSIESGAIVWAKQHYTSKDMKRSGASF
ncbi:MAG: penicillin-binding protein activator LpoB [Zetaproteobacteria bacterium]|nr:penicillin-binding protein activator LpoB [Zetaproteobacteria bacterium]